MEKLLRNLKSINTRNDVDAFHLIVYPPSVENLWTFLEVVPKVVRSAGFKVEMAFTHLEKKPTRSQGIWYSLACLCYDLSLCVHLFSNTNAIANIIV